MRNKTKLLLISALSLCTLSAGVTAIAASANEGQETTNQLELTFGGASVRYVENDSTKNGIRFAVQMSTEDWNDFSDSIEETWMVISYDGKDSTAVDTTKSWYTVDAEGKYAEADFVAYQTTVVMYEIPEDNYTTDFTVVGYAKMKETAEVVESPVKAEDARSMSDVAKEYAGTDETKKESVKEYMYYTVTFDIDGETSTQTAKYGTPVSALEAYLNEVNTDKVGYEFMGWTVNDIALADAIAAGATLTEDVVVKANWEAEEYTVSFEGVEATQTVKYGETATAPTAEPTKAGFIFAGWDFDFSTAITDDVTVQAKWQTVVEVGTYSAFYTAVTTQPEAYVKLTGHINATADKREQLWANGADTLTDFTGTIDGQGYTISNVTFYQNNSNGGSTQSMSMFDKFTGTIKNIGLENFVYSASGNSMENGIIARNFTGTAENVYVHAVFVKNAPAWGFWNACGSMFGVVDDGAVIRNCVTKTTLSNNGNCTYACGYIAGSLRGSATIENVVMVASTLEGANASFIAHFGTDPGDEAYINGQVATSANAASLVNGYLLGTEAEVIAGAGAILGDAWTCNGMELPALAHTPRMTIVEVGTYDAFYTAVTTQPNAYVKLTDNINAEANKSGTTLGEWCGYVDGFLGRYRRTRLHDQQRNVLSKQFEW